MGSIIYFGLWAICTPLALFVLYRVFILERKRPDTNLLYGQVVAFAFFAFIPIFNVLPIVVLIAEYPKYFDTSSWWIWRKVYKAPINQIEEK